MLLIMHSLSLIRVCACIVRGRSACVHHTPVPYKLQDGGGHFDVLKNSGGGSVELQVVGSSIGRQTNGCLGPALTVVTQHA